MEASNDPTLNLVIGTLVLVFILGSVQGFSVTSALLALPVLFLQTLFIAVGYIFSILTAFTIGAAFLGIWALVALIGVWLLLTKGVIPQFSAQNYVSYAVFIMLILLLV